METLNECKNKSRRKIFVFAALFFLIALPIVSHADEETTILKTLQFLEINSTNDFFIDIARRIGYGILKLLGTLVDGCYEGLSVIYSALDFASSSELMALNRKYSVLYKAIFTISVAMLGLYLIGRNTKNQLNTITCIMLIGVILLGMPIFTEKLADMTKAGTSYAQSRWSDSADELNLDTISGSIIDDYIIDLKKVDKNISEDNTLILKNAVKKRTGYNNLDETTKDWRYVDINTVMDYNEDGFSKDFWDKKIEKNEDGYIGVKLSTWISFLDKYYYRYQMSSWLEPILMMMIITIVLILVSFRSAILIWEVAIAEIYLPFIAVTDIASGQRIKEAIKHFFALLGCIFLCIALLGIYFIAYKWINVHISLIFPKLILQAALAYKVIDGPGIIERILGIDVGVKDAWKLAIAAGHMNRKSMGQRLPARAAKAGVKTGVHKASDAMKAKTDKANKEAGKWKANNAGNNTSGGVDPMSKREDNSAANNAQKPNRTNAVKDNEPMTSKNNGSKAGNGSSTGQDPMTRKNDNTDNTVSVNNKATNAGNNTSGGIDPMSRKQQQTVNSRNNSVSQNAMKERPKVPENNTKTAPNVKATQQIVKPTNSKIPQTGNNIKDKHGKGGKNV